MSKEVKQKKKRRTLYELFFKRFFDFILSLIGLIVLSPLFLIVIILELCFHGWPPIYSHYRHGKNGKIFRIYKFRSMNNKKDENGNLLHDKYRVTKFGKFLRKTSIDELAQLVNILKGDMSIVGPRPRQAKDAIFYDEDVLKSYNCRPGITCISQLSGGRTDASWEDIFEKDRQYAENITFWGDVKILFKTVISIFKKDNGGSSEGAGEGNRDYYYPDYLLRTGKITQEQYDKGHALAKELGDTKGKITYQPDLHNKDIEIKVTTDDNAQQ
ncbi:MAG: sugar transferase [Clostridiales bacterium]|nr:sugar transferase [Clostridiales bacterium]